ncbi:MAG: hypothetical protein ACE5JG_09300 [Planctomycetota bacterium]
MAAVNSALELHRHLPGPRAVGRLWEALRLRERPGWKSVWLGALASGRALRRRPAARRRKRRSP